MAYFYSAQCLVILKGGLHSGGPEKMSKSNVIYPHKSRVILKGCLHSGGLEKTSKVQRYIPAQVTSQWRE